MALDPRLADPRLLVLAAMRLKQRQTQGPAIVVVYRDDTESGSQAIQRTLGRQPHAWETVLVVEYAAPLPEEQGDTSWKEF